LKIWDDYFTSPKTVLGVAYGNSAGGVEKTLGPKTSVIWGDQSKNETMQDLISRGPWDVFIDDGSPVPWNRELGQRNWGQGPGGSKLGTGNWDRELGTGNWDRQLGTGNRGQGTGTGNWAQGTFVGA